MEKNAKIYVAGHTGLVGSAIKKNLEAKFYLNIICKTIDELNLINQAETEDFFIKNNPEYVIHAAAHVGGIIANDTYRADFIYNNLQIQNNVISSAYKYGVKKLLFLGSTCIYPREAPQPMTENSLLTGELEYTNEPYAIAKIAGIKLCESYNLQYGTNFISVMPTNLYGPNDNFDLEKSHVLPALIRKIHLGKCLEKNDWNSIRKDLEKRPVKNVNYNSSEEDILKVFEKYGISLDNTADSKKVKVEIWGSGSPMREFLWSEEMADACVFIMENIDFSDITNYCENKNQIRNTHINIGTGKDISIKNLSELIKAIIGFQGDMYFNTTKPDGTMKKLTNPSKLHSLGWQHKIEINEGILKLYNWYKQYNY